MVRDGVKAVQAVISCRNRVVIVLYYHESRRPAEARALESSRERQAAKTAVGVSFFLLCVQVLQVLRLPIYLSIQVVRLPSVPRPVFLFPFFFLPHTNLIRTSRQRSRASWRRWSVGKTRDSRAGPGRRAGSSCRSRGGLVHRRGPNPARRRPRPTVDGRWARLLSRAWSSASALALGAAPCRRQRLASRI